MCAQTAVASTPRPRSHVAFLLLYVRRNPDMARSILLVDDEPDLLASWERVVRPLGHACLTASTGPDAIALIDREAPDLVVTDLRLPGGVDGLAVARHARAHVPPISVFVISAHDSDQARKAARAIGVSAFLAKPLANAAFREAIQRVLADQASGSTDGSVR
jgi:CheY-like chemotaxis protein